MGQRQSVNCRRKRMLRARALDLHTAVSVHSLLASQTVANSCTTGGSMRHRLRDLVRSILAGSVLSASATRPLEAAPTTIELMPGTPDGNDQLVSDASHARELTVRQARPKVLLRALSATAVGLFSSHRSHRSHSSHRSHYSSSSGGGGSSTPAPAKPKSAPSASAVDTPTTRQLGSRTLRKGMRGSDVEQLILLMVRRDLLKAGQIPSEDVFTDTMEIAVKQFQASRGIAADGVVDYRTALLLKVQ
jgi:hypothetical protein